MRTKRRRLIPEEREKRIQRAIEPVLNLFETNEFPKAVAIAALERQGGAIPADRWSLLNYLIMKKHGTDDARTFLQWKEVGRYPRKGSRTFYIVGPVTRQVPKRDEYGELMYDDQGKPQKEPIMVGVRGIPVFRLEDTAGKPLPQYDYSPSEPPPLTGVAERLGLEITYGPGERHRFGYYHTGQAKVYLGTHDPHVFFHELAHAAHDAVGMLRKRNRIDAEIVAETTAAVLSHMYGHGEYLKGAKQYIEHFSGSENPVREVGRLLSDIEITLGKIFEHTKEIQDKPALALVEYER